jgi:hypothetical protein
MLLGLTFAFVATYVPQSYLAPSPHLAYAIDGHDPIDLPFDIKSSIENTSQTVFDGITAKVTSLQWWYNSVIKPMGWALAKAIISSIQRDVVRWINSGFKGSPAFIQDLEGFMIDVADRAAGDFIQEVGGPLSIICSPFRLDIQIALGVQYDRARGKRNRCTLTGAMRNLENFIDGTFSEGGWDTWLNIVHQPNVYTPVGAGLQASAEMGIRISNAQGQQLTLANWGMGFLSSKVCEEPKSPTGPTGTGAGDTAPSQGTQAAERNCKVTTPGQVIVAQLNDTLQLGNQSLVTADEINEVIGAFMQQIVVQTLSGARGLLGLGGNAAYKNPSFNIDQYDAGMETLLDTGQARYFMTQSLLTAETYIGNAKAIINRYERSTAPTDEIRARAEPAYQEAKAILPTLEAKRVTLLNAIAKLDAAQANADKQAAILEFNTLLNSLDTEGSVAEKKVRWDAALDGLIERDDSTFDRRTLTDAIALEQTFLTLTSQVITTYRGLTVPTAAEKVVYEEATDAREEIQSNIIALQKLLIDYDRGGDDRAAAAETYADRKEQWHDKVTVERARVSWSDLLPISDTSYGSGS